MKKNYTFVLLLSCFLAFNLRAQVVYPITTFALNYENAENANLVVFDDVQFNAAQIGANNTLNLTKLRIVIYRAAAAPATDATIWLGVLNNANNLVTFSYGSVTFGVQGAEAQLIALSLGDGLSTIENVPLNKDANGNGSFWIGLQFSNPVNETGWAFYTAPAAPNANSDLFLRYNETTKVTTPYNYAAAPYAACGVEVTGAFAVLPVEMTSFTGKPTGLDQCTLNWTTASEKNNSGYDIEKSFDGKTFAKIDFVKGAGNSLVEQKYEYVDNVFSQNAYYRLKQNDNDGQFEYSKVILVENSKKGKAKTAIYPNPNKGIFVIEHSSETEDIVITNAIGQVVFSNKVKDVNRSEVDISNLPSGLYQVRLMGKNNFREVYPIQLIGR